MDAAANYLDSYQVNVGGAVIEHGTAATADDMVPNAVVAQLARNTQRVVGGDAAAVTRQDWADFQAKLSSKFEEVLAAIGVLSERIAACNHNQSARLRNSVGGRGSSVTYSVLVREKATEGAAVLGAKPPAGFPHNFDELLGLTTETITNLAQHYGEEFAGTSEMERCKAVARFIGVSW